MTQRIILGTALVFVAALAFLTFEDAVENGLTAMGLVSLAVVALLVVGLLGVLSQPPED